MAAAAAASMTWLPWQPQVVIGELILLLRYDINNIATDLLHIWTVYIE